MIAFEACSVCVGRAGWEGMGNETLTDISSYTRRQDGLQDSATQLDGRGRQAGRRPRSSANKAFKP